MKKLIPIEKKNRNENLQNLEYIFFMRNEFFVL